jgi:hypothetical protein
MLRLKSCCSFCDTYFILLVITGNIASVHSTVCIAEIASFVQSVCVLDSANVWPGRSSESDCSVSSSAFFQYLFNYLK